MSWAEPRPEATVWYWNSAYDPHRDRMLEALAKFAPFESILDVGCHVGPMRRRLRESFGPSFQYAGIDINAMAVAHARQFAENDRHAVFSVADIRQMDEWPNVAFDLVITTGSLMCIDPVDLPGVLHTLRRLTRRAVICQEYVGTGNWLDGKGWAHAFPDWVTLVE